MRNAKVKIIDSLGQAGGQPTHLYPEKIIYDIPAYPAISGQELGQQLLQQLDRFDTQFCLGQTIQQIERQADGSFILKTENQTHYSKSLIIAAGNGAFQPRKLELEEANQYEGSSLHYLVQSPEVFRNQRIAVCGGGDSACDWAMTLVDIASQVYLIHRRDQFRAMEHTVSQLRGSDVQILTPYKVIELSGQTQQIESIVLEEVKTKDKLKIEIDHLIVNYGFSTNIGPVKDWGLDLARHQISVSDQMETSTKGIFAIGDIADYPGKVRIIASGFGEAPLAVNQALSYADPNYRPSPIHSSSIF